MRKISPILGGVMYFQDWIPILSKPAAAHLAPTREYAEFQSSLAVLQWRNHVKSDSALFYEEKIYLQVLYPSLKIVLHEIFFPSTFQVKD